MTYGLNQKCFLDKLQAQTGLIRLVYETPLLAAARTSAHSYRVDKFKQNYQVPTIIHNLYKLVNK